MKISLTYFSSKGDEAFFLKFRVEHSYYLISFTFGAVLGAIAVLVFDKMNRKLRGVGDYRARYSAPLLGTVPDFSAKNKEEK